MKTYTLQDSRTGEKEEQSVTTTDGQIVIDLEGNCHVPKQKAGIVIGGYFIHEVGADLLEEPAIRY